MPMPQQSLSDFASAMEAAGMLVRVKEEKRVDELPRVMEDHPTTAVLVEKITGCEFSFLANAYSNQDQYAWAMGCKKSETGMKMVEASLGRIKPVVVGTAPCKEVILKGDEVDMTIFPMFLHHERDGQSYSDDNLVVSKDPDTGVYDWGFYRSMFRAKNERGFDMTCTPSCSYQRPKGGREGQEPRNRRGHRRAHPRQVGRAQRLFAGCG